VDCAAADDGASVKRFLAWLWHPSREMSSVAPLYASAGLRPHCLLLGRWRWDTPSMMWFDEQGELYPVRWEREREIFPDFKARRPAMVTG
jgi:hypothetical protein